METTNQPDQAKAAAKLLAVADHIGRGHLPSQVLRIIDRDILHGPARADRTRPPGWLAVRYTELAHAGDDGLEEAATLRAALALLGRIMRDKRLPDDPAEWQRMAATLRAVCPTSPDDGQAGDDQEVETAGEKGATKKGRATVNARIIDLLQQHPEASGWSARKIAGHLKCGKSTVADSNTYRVLEVERAKAGAERAKSQRRNRRPLSEPDKNA